MKFEKTEVFNFYGAIRGMRNPKKSWDKSDSHWKKIPCGFRLNDKTFEGEVVYKAEKEFEIGDNDLELMQKLIRAGSEHRKFMRQIFVSVDITAPLYWWKEFDTYKVGTVANSTSTMHKLADTPITIDCFEMCDFKEIGSDKIIICGVRWSTKEIWEITIDFLERLRKAYLETEDVQYWKELIRLLPESWLQKRTVTMNYENILVMCRQRRNHRLAEWNEDFIGWARSLPYAAELIFMDEKKGVSNEQIQIN